MTCATPSSAARSWCARARRGRRRNPRAAGARRRRAPPGCPEAGRRRRGRSGHAHGRAVAGAGRRLPTRPIRSGELRQRRARHGAHQRRAAGRVNALDGVLVLTAEADRPVDVGDALGVVKCAPLFLPRSDVRRSKPSRAATARCWTSSRFDRRGWRWLRRRSGCAAVRSTGARGAVERCELVRLRWTRRSRPMRTSRPGGRLPQAAARRGRIDPGRGRLGHRSAGRRLRRAAPGGRRRRRRTAFPPSRAPRAGSVAGLDAGAGSGLVRAVRSARRARSAAAATVHRRGARPGLVRSLALGGLLLGPTRIAPYHASHAAAE